MFSVLLAAGCIADRESRSPGNRFNATEVAEALDGIRQEPTEITPVPTEDAPTPTVIGPAPEQIADPSPVTPSSPGPTATTEVASGPPEEESSGYQLAEMWHVPNPEEIRDVGAERWGNIYVSRGSINSPQIEVYRYDGTLVGSYELWSDMEQPAFQNGVDVVSGDQENKAKVFIAEQSSDGKYVRVLQCGEAEPYEADRINFRDVGGWIPGDVAVDDELNLYVAVGAKGIYKYDPSGASLGIWNVPFLVDPHLGEFGGWVSIDTDSRDNLFAADYYNNRVILFDSFGNFGYRWEWFLGPTDVALDPDSNVLAVESAIDQITRIDADTEEFTSLGMTN